ncbi:MAG TPA: COQ9 family protein [Alphaproteobacteria bacterium]|nr:COQ9 family protein [Alphaproteobacteria bacterium]USO05604.1 MAG: COQ9 family protein [Rhodospirillales bacterium]HOO81687.1 COQ9 family protein [Alphaproteobacteria bacterium]
MKQADDIQNKDKILEKVLPEVAFDGWHWSLVQRIARKEGYSAEGLHALFPGKLKDVLAAFSDLADRKMLEVLQEVDPEDLRIRDRVSTALMARFEWLAQHKEALRQSLQFWMVPMNKPCGARLVWHSADKIWRYAGDRATDYNHYTKRGLLSGVIVSTTLAFLNDETETLDNTRAFLDRRIENVMQLGKVINKVKRVS